MSKRADAQRGVDAVRAVAGWAIAGWLVMSMTACAPSLPRPYLEAQAAAQRAYGAGRYDEAAQRYQDAATAASRNKDRDEMLFLAASAKQRAGRIREARADYEALEKLSPDGERASRAAFEVAQIEIDTGDVEHGYQMLEAMMRRYPKSGLAKRALQRYVAHLDETKGTEAAIAYLQANAGWFKTNGLDEQATYDLADLFERSGQLAQARDTFVRCADEHPYPTGGLWDDALYRAAQLEAKLGNPKAAIALLDRMLKEREVSTFNGSYERPRFGRAQMYKAELYRDALHDHASARREFRRLFNDFTTSLLRDDALWSEAVIAAADKDSAGACEAVKLLAKQLPESRYVPCASLVCPSDDAPQAPTRCRRYIERELEHPEDGGSEATQ